jgi:hypothetical protein
MNFWIVDPKDGKKSVSLSVLILSVAMAAVGVGLECFKVIESSGAAQEFFMACAALYWGRKMTSAKGSSMEAGVSEEPQEKEEP